MKNRDVKTNIFKKFKLEETPVAHAILQSSESTCSIILEP